MSGWDIEVKYMMPFRKLRSTKWVLNFPVNISVIIDNEWNINGATTTQYRSINFVVFGFGCYISATKDIRKPSITSPKL